MRSVVRKGLPFGGDAIGASLFAGELPLPVALLRESALATNQRWMQALLQGTGLSFAPHGKTTMSPELIRRQLDDGAWGITAATVPHVLTYRAWGVDRILLANQLIGRAEIDAVLDELQRSPSFDFYALVDSEASVELLAERLRARRVMQRPLQLLVEVGQAGARTGARTPAAAIAIARKVAATPGLALRGVELYEGVLHGSDENAVDAAISALFDCAREVLAACERERLFAPGEVVVSAGGSCFLDLASAGLEAFRSVRPVRGVLRSGCYLTHDAGWLQRYWARMNERGAMRSLGVADPQPALEVWAYVQSMPDPGRALLNFGKRDVSYDIDLPVPQAWFRPGLHDAKQPLAAHRVTGLNDQHCYLECPLESPLRVGDAVQFGISHPCTTFDKWRVLPIVDDRYVVISLAHTEF